MTVRDSIFISYRRDDAGGYARLLYDRLERRYSGRVFMDIRGIGPGADFVERIEQALSACGVLVVLIGSRWASATDEKGRTRLEDPEDVVRQELEAGLALDDIRVVPVLLGGAAMPVAAQLPQSLAPLTRRQAIDLRDASLDEDVARLCATIDEVLGASGDARPRSRRLVWTLAAVGVLALGIGIFLQSADEPDPPQQPRLVETENALLFEGPGHWRIAYSGRATGAFEIDLHDDRSYTMSDVGAESMAEGGDDMEEAIGNLVDAFGGLARAQAGKTDAVRAVLGASGTWTYDRGSHRLTLLPSAASMGLGIVLSERTTTGYRGSDGAGVAFELERLSTAKR